MKLGWRIWILIIALALSLLAISPSFQKGVLIKSVDVDSYSFSQGMRAGEIIKDINGNKITNIEDYAKAMDSLFLDGTEKRLDIVTDKSDYTLFVNETPKISVSKIPATKIKMGLDLRGGARALVQPDEKINENELNELIEITRNRLNVYGLSDLKVRGVSDLEGNRYMLIEIAGATPDDLEELISKQGKFEAKIMNQTVFGGGKGDISDVCRNDATCSVITDCLQGQGGYYCNFRFAVYLTEEAAKKHAEITKNISLDETGRYLSEKLYLYVDDKEMDSLLVSSSLRGQVTTQIQIQGSGTGGTREEAYNDAVDSRNKLQTILITGSLPYKLNIVKLDTISPTLGNQFISLIIIAGAVSILLVSLIIFFRYRRIKASLALLLTSFSEILIILGIASFINWNLDLPSIAGILATVGTGVDSQIVILDEASKKQESSLKERIKRALFIVLTAYLTSFASLLPLGWAGAGLFKGFAITTIIGITAGVFISRPAFAEMIRRIEKD